MDDHHEAAPLAPGCPKPHLKRKKAAAHFTFTRRGQWLEASNPAPHIRAVTDPISPEIIAWLEALPLRERLTMLHAMALAFPQLQRSRD
jgi:hypothetical protein